MVDEMGWSEWLYVHGPSTRLRVCYKGHLSYQIIDSLRGSVGVGVDVRTCQGYLHRIRFRLERPWFSFLLSGCKGVKE